MFIVDVDKALVRPVEVVSFVAIVPVRVVTIVPVLVVTIVPLFVVTIIPDLPNAVAEMAATNINEQDIDVSFFISSLLVI